MASESRLSRSRGDKAYRSTLRAAQSGRFSDEKIAEKLARAADRGSPDALYALATWYLHGKHFSKNIKKAVVLLKTAAKRGVAEACYDLATCYALGAGVQKDEERAFELYMEAALRGDIDSHEELCRCYWYGTGTRKNKSIADLWGRRYDELNKQKTLADGNKTLTAPRK